MGGYVVVMMHGVRLGNWVRAEGGAYGCDRAGVQEICRVGSGWLGRGWGGSGG